MKTLLGIMLFTMIAAESPRRVFDSTSSFTFVLIGRDRGEKLRSSDVVTAEKLFSLIDAMPMRKNEIEHSQREKPE